MRSGIYKIENTVNGKCYVGSAVDIKKRWRRHLCLLRAGRHHSAPLQNGWNKHGEENFSFSVMLRCRRTDLLRYEQAALDFLKPRYNVCVTAGSQLGLKRTPEIKAKMSARLLGNTYTVGYIHTAETRAKLSAVRKGKPHTPEWNARISAAHKGKKMSAEACRNISLGKMNPSAETRERMAAAKRGKPSNRLLRRRLNEAVQPAH